ncbi:MAG: hypothetical protein KDD61_13800 [Bdellovibrionales bacterium]|nr:hypothetical protein [Bdellovibrionales bacterium]
MINYEVYKIIHLLGLFMVFGALGGLLMHLKQGGSKESFSGKKFFSIVHGIGLTLAILGGFGLLARLKISASEGWVLLKIAFWVLLAVFSLLAYRAPRMVTLFWGVLFFIGGTAVYLVQYKPF